MLYQGFLSHLNIPIPHILLHSLGLEEFLRKLNFKVNSFLLRPIKQGIGFETHTSGNNLIFYKVEESPSYDILIHTSDLQMKNLYFYYD